MTSSASPPDARIILDSLRDYLDQLREEGIEGLPGTLSPGRTEGRPLPLSAARPARQLEVPEPKLTLQRETIEQRSAVSAGAMASRVEAVAQVNESNGGRSDEGSMNRTLKTVGAVGASEG